METENQSEIQSLATWLENISGGISAQKAASELRRLHDKVQELEAMLSAVGAGGVSAQRVTQGKDHIEQPIEMVAPPVVLPEPVAAQVRHIKEKRWKTIALDLYDLFAGGEYERRYIYTEKQVRELLATGGKPQADLRDAELVAAVVYASAEAMASSMESPSFDETIILESHHAASLSLALDELEQHRAAIAKTQRHGEFMAIDHFRDATKMISQFREIKSC